MQALSDVFNLFRLEAFVYNNAKFCGNWEVPEGELGQTCFHMPTDGECLMIMEDGEEIVVAEGDTVIFPYELPHRLRSLKSSKKEAYFVPYPQAKEEDGMGIICGRFTFEHPSGKHILDQLPPYFIVKNDHSAQWLEPFRQLIIAESLQSNSSAVLNRLSELLFIHSVRQWLEQLQPDIKSSAYQPSSLSLYGDPKIAAAVTLMHQQPNKEWGLEELATAVNMSRTAFAARFKKVSGWTAMQYLTWWRMQLAWQSLASGRTVAQVADEVGYQSEVAFAKAFKREFGVNVGVVRRGRV